MLPDILDLLVDPADPHGAALKLSAEGLHANGHTYPLAEAGYAIFLLEDTSEESAQGDDPAMLHAREAFLSRGHFAPFVEAVSTAVHDAIDEAGIPEEENPIICEIGAGTGYYLAHNLDEVYGALGIGIDISPAAAEHLASCHPRVGAVVADAQRLPLRDGVVDALTVIFSPYNPTECARVLTAKGQLIALVPEPGHLQELRQPLGIRDVEAGSVEHFSQQAAQAGFRLLAQEPIEFSMRLDRESIKAQIGMSPSARDIPEDELAERAAQLAPAMTVTAKASLLRFIKN